MQANTAEHMPAGQEQLGVPWNGFSLGYGEYSIPNTDWITPLATDLDSASHSSDSVAQSKDFYQPMIGGGMPHISPLNSSNEAVEAEAATEHRYPFGATYHHYPYHHPHQAVNYGPKYYQHAVQQSQQPQQKYQQQPARKLPTNGARYVPTGFYTTNDRTSATDGSGSPMTQPSLYPSPPGQSHSAEESSYTKPYSGLLYMNGDHVPPPPPTMSFSGHGDPTLPPNLYSGGPVFGDHYQSYSVPTIGYEEGNTVLGMDSTAAQQKYDAWSTDIQPIISPMGYPVLSHAAHSLGLKQEYIPPAYASPAPSSLAGGSSIKLELMSDSSRSPPPDSEQHSMGVAVVPPHPALPPVQCPSPLLKPKEKRTAKSETPAGKKPTRNTNNYGDQFACPECRRTFARQCGLTQHTKWHHSGEKPFRCLTCGKCFGAQIALDDHIERHTTTDKPYQCAHCPKAFFHKNDLRRHGFQHTGKAPHSCRYCTKTFARKDHCHSHECAHERKLQRKERKAKGTRDQVVVSSIELPAVTTVVLDTGLSVPMGAEVSMQFLDTTVEQRITA